MKRLFSIFTIVFALLPTVVFGQIGGGISSPNYFKLIGSALTPINSSFFLSMSATSTGSKGWNLSGGCFAVNGVCIGGSSGTIGSGTQGQVPFYNAAGTTLTATSTIFISQDQKVGIGTQTPAYALDVVGSITSSVSINTGNNGSIGNSAGTSGRIRFYGGLGPIFDGLGGQVVTDTDAADQFAFRNGSNPNVVSIYNTYTNASNYEKLFVGWESNNAYILTRRAGTGTARNLVLGTEGSASTGVIVATGAGVNRWQFDGSGHFSPVVDVTYDIGISSTNRVRNTYSQFLFATGIRADAYNDAANAVSIMVHSGTTNTFYDGSGVSQLSLVGTSGNTGIASTSPWAKLSINPNGISGPSFAIGSSTKTDFVVTNGGFVGIGNSAPLSLFHIKGASASQTIQDSVGNTTSLLFRNATPTTLLTIATDSGANASVTAFAQLTFDTGAGSPFDLQTGGVLRARLTSAGDFGIGTTSPWGKLSVTNTGTGPSFIVEDTTSPDSTPFIVDANGNTGIGMIPTYKLDVTGFINTDSFSGYKQAGNTILYASTTNFSTLTGDGAGAALTATGLRNTATGYQSLNALTTGDDNTAIGYIAGKAMTTGMQNVAIGSEAMQFSTSGSGNVAVGVNAIGDNTNTGDNNTVVGFNSLVFNTSGSTNTVIGANLMTLNTTGSTNTAVGSSILSANTSGQLNVGMGSSVLAANTTGTNLVGIGVTTLNANTTGAGSVAIGGQSLASQTTADENVGVGYGSGNANTTGANSTSIGTYANYYNKLGASNVAIGHSAGFGVSTVTTHSQSTFVGAKSAYAITTGGTNIAIGYQAADNLTSGSKNIIIGTDIDAPSATNSNQLNVGNIIFGTGVSGTGTTIAGNIGIATTTPSSLFQVFSTATTTVSIDSNSTSKGGCIEMKDASGVGYSYLTVEDGVLSASTISCK